MMSLCGKRRYVDETQVRAAGMVSLAEHGGRERLWFYRCNGCHGYHLTKSAKSRRQLITADNPVHEPALDIGAIVGRAIDVRDGRS